MNIFQCHLYHPFSRNDRIFVLVCTFLVSLLAGALTLHVAHDVCSDSEVDCNQKRENQQVLLSFGFGLIVVVYTVLMKIFATCSCVQTQGETARCCGEACGSCVNIVLGIISLVLGIVGIVVVSRDAGDAKRFIINLI